VAEFTITIAMNKTLHWEQRIALVRHNLHTASRSGDFTFFKTLQAQGFIEGTNHVATLSATLGDGADAILSGLDDLNSSIAYMHRDAFKNVYNSLKTYLGDDMTPEHIVGKSKIYVDATMQKQMAKHAIDKMTSSAITLIKQQPESVQDTAASVWITGNTITADCMEICIKQIDMLENNMNDFIRLEDSWDMVKTSVGCTISALKGVFNLMSVEECNETSRPSSVFAGAGGNMFRRLSSAFVGGSSPSSRHSSVSAPPASARRDSSTMEYITPNYLRATVSNAVPTSLPSSSTFPQQSSFFPHTQLSTIPPTPAVLDDEINPFDTSVPLPRMPTAPEVSPTAV